MRVRTERHELSDHSEVFDVVIFKEGVSINIPACSESDARELTFKIVEALRDHSTETVREW